MFQRLLFLGPGLAALLWVMAIPDLVHAQRRGGFRSGFRPTMGNSFGMQHRGMFSTHSGGGFGQRSTGFGQRGAGTMHSTSMRTPTMRQPTMNMPTMNTPTMNMPTMNMPTMRR